MIRPVRMGTKPISERSSVVLPTPLRPSSAVTLPAGSSKPDIAQDVAAAVVLVEVLNEHEKNRGQSPISCGLR